MSNRFEFFINTFRGIGFALTFGIYDKHLLGMVTFLCFNFHMEIKIKK